MPASKRVKGAVDDQRTIRIEAAPFTGHTVVTIVISHREGSARVDRRLARWHVPLTRADLAGHTTDDVLLTVLGMVMHRIESRSKDPADANAKRDGSTAVGPGSPGGGHGGGMIQDPLPGVPADSDTPGSVDRA